MGFFDNLKSAFSAKKDKQHYLNGFRETSRAFNQRLGSLKERYQTPDAAFYEELMVILIQSDIGLDTANRILDTLKKKVGRTQPGFEEIKQLLYEAMSDVYGDPKWEHPRVKPPLVIFLVGVNGSGKTTTAAKLANYFKERGRKVLLVAADTFRAGAIRQLDEWAKRLDLPCVRGKEGGDPASAVVDGLRFGKENEAEVILVDTAGRLQNKNNLMKELAKMHKVAGREIEGAPHLSWLVLDATTGQNGLSQAKIFLEATSINGIILTKMDGTSKGGIVLAIKDQLKLPVCFVGTGESLDALREFDLDSYLYSIAEGMEDGA